MAIILSWVNTLFLDTPQWQIQVPILDGKLFPYPAECPWEVTALSATDLGPWVCGHSTITADVFSMGNKWYKCKYHSDFPCQCSPPIIEFGNQNSTIPPSSNGVPPCPMLYHRVPYQLCQNLGLYQLYPSFFRHTHITHFICIYIYIIYIYISIPWF